MSIKIVKIDDVEYVRADSVDIKPTHKQIFVLQRGWVVIGDQSKDGQCFNLTNCSVIRTWGTTEGLGELAKNGPNSSTTLDDCPSLQIHELTVVLRMNVDADKW